MAQVIRAGTYDDIFGPGSTPGYGSADAVYKYADSEVVQTEAGYQLNFSARSPAVTSAMRALDVCDAHEPARELLPACDGLCVSCPCSPAGLNRVFLRAGAHNVPDSK